MHEEELELTDSQLEQISGAVGWISCIANTRNAGVTISRSRPRTSSVAMSAVTKGKDDGSAIEANVPFVD